MSSALGESSDQELATAAAAVENDKNGLQEAITAPGMVDMFLLHNKSTFIDRQFI